MNTRYIAALGILGTFAFVAIACGAPKIGTGEVGTGQDTTTEQDQTETDDDDPDTTNDDANDDDTTNDAPLDPINVEDPIRRRTGGLGRRPSRGGTGERRTPARSPSPGPVARRVVKAMVVSTGIP